MRNMDSTAPSPEMCSRVDISVKSRARSMLPTKPEVAPEDKLDFKKLLPVIVIVFVDLLGMTIIIPLMPLYAVSFGANAFTIGLLGAIYPLMQFIGAPILGRLSDQYGRKPILLISQLGTLAGFLVLGG